MNELIKYQDEKQKGNVKNLIPIHINTCRCENYYWNWHSNIGDWVRGREIDEQMKAMYKNPLIKSNYM